MEITVKNFQKKIQIIPSRIRRIAKIILENEGLHKAHLCVVFLSCQRIRAFNKKFKKRNYATDVLAFYFSNPKGVLEGDILISTDAAVKNAHIYRTSVEGELILYLVHGILHLLGYDDHKKEDIQKMRRKEQDLLNYFKEKKMIR